MTFTAIAAKLQRIVCVGLAALVIGSTLLMGFSAPAVALGNEAGDIVQGRAERELDRVSGSGTANQLEGSAQENFGKAQRQVEKVTGGNDSFDNQAKGRAQRDIGRTQGTVEDATDAAKDSAEGFVESVKDFFGQ